MPKPPVFRATYSDYKLVRSRKVSQFIFEVSIEATNDALTVLGGMPNPATEVWCGIARLQEPDSTSLSVEGREAAHAGVSHAGRPAPRPSSGAEPAGDRRRWDDMSPAQQAGLLCNDLAFRRFLAEDQGYAPTNAERQWGVDDAAEAVREICGVTSRAQILPGTEAGERWRALIGQYRFWQHNPELVG